MLLLRLRQICSHPSLIQEDGVAFVHPDEAHVKPEFATELTRARRIVSPEFVAKMKEKFKQQALGRMEVEKKVDNILAFVRCLLNPASLPQSTNATIEEEDCPICFDAMTDAVVTPCTHIFCRDCIGRFLDSSFIWCVGDLIHCLKSTSSTKPLRWMLRTKLLEVVPRIAHVSFIHFEHA